MATDMDLGRWGWLLRHADWVGVDAAKDLLMARGPQGEMVELGTATVTLDSAGDGTQAVSFTESFIDVPEVAVAAPRADAGSWTAASITKTGFTATASSSDLTAQDFKITWIAVEKG